MESHRTININIDYKIAYAAYVAYQLRSFILDEDVDNIDIKFNNIEVMKQITEIALNHFYQVVFKEVNIITDGSGYLPEYEEIVDINAFYDDGYEDACRLFDLIMRK